MDNDKTRWKEFNLIIDNEDLNIKEKGLLLILFRYINYKNGYANPSRDLIKKLYGTKKDNVIDKILNSLIQKGYLTRESRKGERSKYFIQIENIVPSQMGGTPQMGGIVPPQMGGIVPPQIGGQKEKKRKIKEKYIYSLFDGVDSEKYFDEVNKKLEEDLLNEIKNKYPQELIKNELDKLKDKELSNLDLLKELAKNLETEKKEDRKDIKNIFDSWNSKGIIKHKELNKESKKAIEKALKVYSETDIIQAIGMYSEILKSDYRFNYKWSLKDFLNRENGISSFMPDGSNTVNYLSWKDKNKCSPVNKQVNNKTKLRGWEPNEL